MNSSFDEIPPIPRVPLVDPLHIGITTRVMASKQKKQLESIGFFEETSEERRRSSLSSQGRERRPSKFLEGAAIPNSIIRADLNVVQPAGPDSAKLRKERDEFVEKATRIVLKRLQPQQKMHHSIYDESVDRAALDKIKRELQKKSLIPLHSGIHDQPSVISTLSAASKITKDLWEEIKEKRRISRRTSILAPLAGERRSTYESIRKAIQNSSFIQQLIDIDNIEQHKLKQIQTGKSLLFPDLKADIRIPSQIFSKTILKAKPDSATSKKKVKLDKKSSLNTKSSFKRKNSVTSSKSDNKKVIKTASKKDLQTQTSFAFDIWMQKISAEKRIRNLQKD